MMPNYELKWGLFQLSADSRTFRENPNNENIAHKTIVV